jgi:hypothetical protein
MITMIYCLQHVTGRMDESDSSIACSYVRRTELWLVSLHIKSISYFCRRAVPHDQSLLLHLKCYVRSISYLDLEIKRTWVLNSEAIDSLFKTTRSAFKIFVNI